VIVGGETAYKVWKEKDWVIALHWVDYQGKGEQPTMILRPARWAGYKPPGAAPYCLQLDQCYKLVNSNGYPTERLIEAAGNCCAVTNTFPDRPTLHNLCDIILNAVEELVKMPPRKLAGAPEDVEDGPAVGEMTLVADGQEVASRVVTVPGDRLQ